MTLLDYVLMTIYVGVNFCIAGFFAYFVVYMRIENGYDTDWRTMALAVILFLFLMLPTFIHFL